jgi:pyrroloquinoline quinone (PQQ) biosynthesis protein C
MGHLVESYDALLELDSVAALAGLLAYESQGAGIADSKAEGLASRYGVQGGALEFWTVHGSIEGDHASWTYQALSLLKPDLDLVALASRLVGDAWWSFLDEREELAA